MQRFLVKEKKKAQSWKDGQLASHHSGERHPSSGRFAPSFTWLQVRRHESSLTLLLFYCPSVFSLLDNNSNLLIELYGVNESIPHWGRMNISGSKTSNSLFRQGFTASVRLLDVSTSVLSWSEKSINGKHPNSCFYVTVTSTLTARRLLLFTYDWRFAH